MMRKLSLDEAKPIWDKFVPEKEVWTDDWDFRVALCEKYKYEPLILYDKKNFFPLQYDSDDGFYSFIGGESVEKNYLTFDPEFMKKTKEIPENIYFDYLDRKFEGCTESLCPQFFIDLTKINNMEDYLKRFSGKRQKNFRLDIEKFGEYEFRKHGHVEELARLNKEMFGKESDFEVDRTCYEMLDKDKRTEYWSILKNGKITQITQFFFYDKTVSVSVWGVDKKYSDTLKIAIKETISLAKSRGCTRIDYAPTYSGWKEFYKLDTTPLWRYKRGNIPDSVDTAEHARPNVAD